MPEPVAINRTKPLNPPLLSVRDVSAAYISRNFGPFGKKEVKPVLNHVNLEMAAGEIFGLVGESGCGKSTLARCVLGLIGYEGEIAVGGWRQERRGGAARLERAQRAQMVFQDPGGSLNPAKRIGWLLEEPLVIHRIGGEAERARTVDETLARVGLDLSYKNRRPTELSGGQKQRVCIARALILNPRLLIADEAVNSLDVSVAAQILNLFRDLNKSLGLGILFISHNIDAVEYLCDRIAVMKNGQITR